MRCLATALSIAILPFSASVFAEDTLELHIRRRTETAPGSTAAKNVSKAFALVADYDPES